MTAPNEPRDAVARTIFISAEDHPGEGEADWNAHLCPDDRKLAFLAADAILSEHIAPRDAEIERLTRINTDVCASHNALLADGAKWEARAHAAEAQLVTLREQLAAAEARAEEAEEAKLDAVSTLSAWFDVKAKIDADLPDMLAQSLSGHLRVCRAGGMPSKLSHQVEAALAGFLRTQAGLVLAPVFSRLVSAEVSRLNAAFSEERARVAGELTPTLGQLRHLYPIVRRMNEELADGLLAPEIRQLEKLHRALTTPEAGHAER